MEIPDWIAQLVVGAGGGAAVTVGLLKFFGEKWIKHTLDKDLEFAKAEISFHAAKRIRLHDKEYEVFPDIWKKLIEAHTSLSSALTEFRQVPDFGRMSKPQIKKWVDSLDSSEFSKEQKEKLIYAEDVFSVFNDILDYKKLIKAEENYKIFSSCLQGNRIFLNPEVREQLDAISFALRRAWAAKHTDYRMSGRQDFLEKAMKIFEDDVQPSIHKIERLMQSKLFPEEKG